MISQEQENNSRQSKQKTLVLDQLKKTPIIKVACERSGVPRATLYRWQQEDEEFRKAVDIAIIEGRLMINDMSEYQLLSLIQDRNPTIIRYWLEKHHPDYMKKGQAEELEDDSPSVIILHDDED
jgi:hypothetical protein